MSLISADAFLGDKVNNDVKFETWVVCFGANPKKICGLGHIRWGYKRQGGVVTKYDLDGSTCLADGVINNALANGLFGDWTFSIGHLACCPPPPACQVSPTSLDFGTVPVGSYVDKTFTITNTGGGTLSGTISASCDYYSIVSGGGAYNLQTGQSRTVTVRFAPSQAGTYTCMVETGNSLCSDVYCTGTGFASPPPPSRPTLSQWVLIVLALSVGGFFVWQLKRRRKAGVSA
jgi:hypothetical protein